MTLSDAIERLKVEKSYAEYALIHNPNDERYKSLVDAIETTRKWIDDLVCCISRFSDFETKEYKDKPDKPYVPCCARGSDFVSPREESTLQQDADELPFG